MSGHRTNGISVSLVLFETPVSQIQSLLRCLNDSGQVDVLYVIDNSPSDALRTSFNLPWVKYFHNKKNLGYGAGHNIAINLTLESFDLHLVVNPDIYFESDQLVKAINRARNDTSVGQLMPKILNHDGTIQYNCKLLPSPIDLIIRRFTLPVFQHFFKLRLDQYELRSSGYDMEMNVPSLSGCFMLLKTDALKEVGLFDERFFMYAEDMDLTRRIHEKYVTLYYPDAFVTHLHTRESYRSIKMFCVHCINIARYFSKWGWIFDPERKKINKELIKSLQELKSSTP